MAYKLCKIPLGTSAISPIFDIDTDMAITGMYHIEGFGFVFLFRDHHCLGYADEKGKVVVPWLGKPNESGNRDGGSPLFQYPSSICYSENLRSCFFLHD